VLSESQIDREAEKEYNSSILLIEIENLFKTKVGLITTLLMQEEAKEECLSEEEVSMREVSVVGNHS
jgi:hypothetical protein